MTLALPIGRTLPTGEIKLGIRPEYVSLVPAHSLGALEMTVSQVQDVGTHVMLSAQFAGQTVKARLSPDAALPASGDTVWLRLLGEHTCFYKDEEIMQ